MLARLGQRGLLTRVALVAREQQIALPGPALLMPGAAAGRVHQHQAAAARAVVAQAAQPAPLEGPIRAAAAVRWLRLAVLGS